MLAIGLAIGGVPGVGLEGSPVVWPALQEQPLGGGPLPLLLMEKRQVPVGARQFVAQVRLVGEVGYQLLPNGQGLVVVLLRLRQTARGTQQIAPVVVAGG